MKEEQVRKHYLHYISLSASILLSCENSKSADDKATELCYNMFKWEMSD